MHPARLLVVGRGSFLARHFLERMPSDDVTAVGHEAIGKPDLLDGVRCVVNFARHPAITQDDYNLSTMDTDVRLAERIGGRDIAYVMLSSRKVYAWSSGALAEDAPIGPHDAYGRNKRAAEEALRNRLGERLTVLRLANIFGYERGPGRRTFLSILLDRLAREARIRFDMSPFVERDFLPVERLADLLVRIGERPPGVVVNVGSGIGLPTGRVALWILEGFGHGELVIRSSSEYDPFVLDVGRLRSLYGEPCTFDQLRERCLALGRQLADEVGRECS
jgi:UDP-glucose 4-epimerase